MNTTRKSSGLLLIVLVGLLTLLTVLSVALVVVTRTERFSTVTGQDDVRARLLTWSGVEYAVARLRNNPDPDSGVPSDPVSVGQAFQPAEDDWTYRETETVPLHSAANPSYHAGEPWREVLPNGRYDEGVDVYEDLNGNDRYDGWSGRLRGTYQPYGETFSLRIEGGEGKINLNGGFLDDLDRDEDGIPDHRDTWVDQWVNGYHPEGWTDESGTGKVRDAYNVGQGWNGQLTRMLDNLMEGMVPAIALERDAQTSPKIEAEKRAENPFHVFGRSEETIGTWLISHRPKRGYDNWTQVGEVMKAGFAAGAFTPEGAQGGLSAVTSLLPSSLPTEEAWIELLRSHVTLHSWSDRVVHPRSMFPKDGMFLTYKPSSLPFAPDVYHTYMTFKEIGRWLGGPPLMEERSPIQVNLASRPVLYAAAADLGQLGLVDVSAYIAPSVALRIADRIIRTRSGDEDGNRNGRLEEGEDTNENGYLDAPFRSWRQWNEFCIWLHRGDRIADGSATVKVDPVDGVFGGKQVSQGYSVHEPSILWWSTPLESSIWRAKRARILKIHFNPNGSSARWLAEGNLFIDTDFGGAGTASSSVNTTNSFYPMKDNIFPYSTEWSFHVPTVFSVESFGRVQGAGGELRSHRTAWGEVTLAGVYRASTQKDFVAGRTFAGYSNRPSWGVSRTDGAAMNRLGPETGTAVTTWPEPMHLPPLSRAAGYDGYVSLASVEETPSEKTTFLHHFDDSWDADLAPGGNGAEPVDGDDSFRERAGATLWDDDDRFPSLLPNGGMFAGGHYDHPGGPKRGIRLHASWPQGNAASFPVAGNLPDGGRRGGVMFWSESAQFMLSREEGDRTQRLIVLASGGKGGMLVENGMDEPDHYDSDADSYPSQRERVVDFRGAPGFRAAYWNLREGDIDKDALMWGQKSFWGPLKKAKSYPSLPYVDYGSGHSDIEGFSDPDPQGWEGTRFTLGIAVKYEVPENFAIDNGNNDRKNYWKGQEVHTAGTAGQNVRGGGILDEFAIYDFGESADAADLAGKEARRYFQDGRYYKGNDAEFRSPWLDFGNARVRRVYWTLAGVPLKNDNSVEPLWWNDRGILPYLTVRLSGSDGETQELTNEAGEEPEFETKGPVRYIVRFVPTPPEEPDGSQGMTESERMETPLLYSPVFDDITIVYDLSEPRVRVWEDR